MASQDSQEIADQAEAIYERHLKALLERSHPGAFVAIEPVSGDHFLGRILVKEGVPGGHSDANRRAASGWRLPAFRG